jgi:hypothetical protein
MLSTTFYPERKAQSTDIHLNEKKIVVENKGGADVFLYF